MEAEGREMSHWEYIVWAAASGPAGLVTWRYASRTFLMLIQGPPQDADCSRQCAEMLRLQREDAKDLPSYVTTHHRIWRLV
jgi:hypothetical protein